MVALTPPWEPLGCIMAGGLLLVGVGMWDDYFAISRGARIAAQIGAALLAIYAADVRLYDLGNLSLTGSMLTLGMLSVPFTVFSIVGATNALNLIDGTDGLAGTLTVLALLALMVMAGLAGRDELLQISTCLASAVSAFLAFNLPSMPGHKFCKKINQAGSMACSANHRRIFWLVQVHSNGLAYN
jgi:UDP-GlcNAc:undecaprenyl-phosphate GlcNAc-1-phosphate transferase